MSVRSVSVTVHHHGYVGAAHGSAHGILIYIHDVFGLLLAASMLIDLNWRAGSRRSSSDFVIISACQSGE